ncbi:MAG: hypothetical protein ACLTSL_15770 [Odoribacter splanchnicus]
MSTEEYLVLFGETPDRSNKLEGDGLQPTILGDAVWHDSLDNNFHNYGYLNRIVNYDPEDLNQSTKRCSMKRICCGNFKWKLNAKNYE